MTLERLLEAPAPSTTPEPRAAKVEVKGGVVQITYTPPPKDADEIPTEELLNRYLATWNVERDGAPAALNADVIHALDPAVRDAFRETILAKPKVKAAEKPAEKSAEVKVELKPTGHGTVTPVAEKDEPKSGSK